MMGNRTVQILRREGMEITLPALIRLFAATKQTEGRTRKTVDWYTNMVGRFAAYLGEEATIKDVPLDNAQSFVAYLQAKTSRYAKHPFTPKREGGLSPYTIHGYVRALKAFSSWLHEEGFTRQNTLVRLKRPKLPQPMIEILSDQEIADIVRTTNPACFLGARQHLMVLLLLDTGIRASELRTLTVENTYVDENYVKVVGKGRKERIVPFGNTAKKALLRYLVTWRPDPAGADVDELILSVSGTPPNARRPWTLHQASGKTGWRTASASSSLPSHLRSALSDEWWRCDDSETHPGALDSRSYPDVHALGRGSCEAPASQVLARGSLGDSDKKKESPIPMTVVFDSNHRTRTLNAIPQAIATWNVQWLAMPSISSLGTDTSWNLESIRGFRSYRLRGS